MSNNHSAVLGKAPVASSTGTATNAKPSIWRRMFDAWLLSYANRMDPDGNVMCEL